MRLLGSAANTVMGLAGLGVGAYNAFKGAGPASKGVLVSEVKSKLKKKYPFLDEASLNIISKRYMEEFIAANQTEEESTPAMSASTTGSGTTGTTTPAYNNQLAQKLKLSPDQVNKMAKQVQDTTGLNLAQLRQLTTDPNS